MASHDAVSERGELELKVKFAGAAQGTEIEQTYSHYIIQCIMKGLHVLIITCRHQTQFILSEAVSLLGFHTLGTTGPTERLNGGHEGETQVNS